MKLNVYDRWATWMPPTVNTSCTHSSGVRAIPDWSMPAASRAFTLASTPAEPRSSEWLLAVLQRS